MDYTFLFLDPLSHFISIKLSIKNICTDEIFLGIPTWRPGRYEAANYAKNIRNLKIIDQEGISVPHSKVNHSTWKVDTKSIGEINITYEYFAFKMDAGNSWFDENLIYLNFINCLVYDKSRQNEACSVSLNIPPHYKVSCGLPSANNVYTADSYFDLVDSPLIASGILERYEYSVLDRTFNIWINGKHTLDLPNLIRDFQMFSEVQVRQMGEFPEDTYHFQILSLPHKIYHGVEHRNSTVICLGPGDKIHEEALYSQLLGVCSHELFHAWNVIKIRPKELLPYQFDKEVTFPTGYVAEGFTTYYGDLFLVRSKVFDHDWYFKELNILFKRHYSNFGRLNYSLIDSSIDLWVDGYTLGTPHRKSSIYVEGAIVALTLDLMIRERTEDESSLDDIMRILAQEYGKSDVGYSHPDIKRICEAVYGDDLAQFFKDHIEGTKPKDDFLNNLLDHVGCFLSAVVPENPIERLFGIRYINQNGRYIISLIAPDSIGEKTFSIDDEILKVNNMEPNIENIAKMGNETYVFFIVRNHEKIEIELQSGPDVYFDQYAIEKLVDCTDQQEKSLRKWLDNC